MKTRCFAIGGDYVEVTAHLHEITDKPVFDLRITTEFDEMVESDMTYQELQAVCKNICDELSELVCAMEEPECHLKVFNDMWSDTEEAEENDMDEVPGKPGEYI